MILIVFLSLQSALPHNGPKMKLVDNFFKIPRQDQTFSISGNNLEHQ